MVRKGFKWLCFSVEEDRLIIRLYRPGERDKMSTAARLFLCCIDIEEAYKNGRFILEGCVEEGAGDD